MIGHLQFKSLSFSPFQIQNPLFQNSNPSLFKTLLKGALGLPSPMHLLGLVFFLSSFLSFLFVCLFVFFRKKKNDLDH